MAKVVLWVGNSQCHGRAANSGLDSAYTGVFSSIQTWTGSATASLSQAANNNQYPTATAQGGSEFAFLSLCQTRWGENVYHSKYGVGGSFLANKTPAVEDWNTANRGELLDKALTEFNELLIYLWNTLGIRTYDFYIITNLGENDGGNATDAGNFQTNLTNFVNSILANIGGSAYSTSDKVFIHVKPNSGQTGVTQHATINAAIDAVCAAIPYNYSQVTLGEPMSDGVHWTVAGYASIGTNMYNNTIVANNY